MLNLVYPVIQNQIFLHNIGSNTIQHAYAKKPAELLKDPSAEFYLPIITIENPYVIPVKSMHNIPTLPRKS